MSFYVARDSVVTISVVVVIFTTTTPFSGLFCRTAWVSRYQTRKANLDLNEARDNGVLGQQWHHLLFIYLLSFDLSIC